MCSYFFAQSYMCEMLIYLNLSINYNIHNFFIFFPKLFFVGQSLEEGGSASQESRQVDLPPGVWNKVHNEGMLVSGDGLRRTFG